MHKIEDIKLPNLFIVGAGRAGTTSLYQYLKQHPEVFMSPIKEPNYFSRHDIYEFHDGLDLETVILDFQEYISLFRCAKFEKIRGEASTNYLFSKKAPLEISKLIPDAKIIISLRNPIERALSHFQMNIIGGLVIAKNFCEAINKRPLYLYMSLYYEHVKRYLEIFPKHNVKIIIYDDLKNYTLDVLKDIFEFLEIDRNYATNIDLKVYNKSLVPKNLTIYMLALKVRKAAKKFFPPLFYSKMRTIYRKFFMMEKSDSLESYFGECKDFLYNYFKEDVRKLSELLGRDLSFWFEKWDYKV